jgi:outer membrane protein TolC
LPRLDVTDMQLWSWATPSLSPNVLPGLNPAALGHAPKDVTANVLAVSVSQPLLGLAHLSQDYAATRHQARAEQQTFDATLAALRAEVRSKLLSLFKARALTRTAVSSQQSLEEQVEDARQEAEAGALAPADVLRMEAAAANAKQQVIASQAQAESLHADLLEMLDLADGPDGIDFVEPPTADVDVSGLAALPTLRAQALEQRPELHAQSHLAQAAAKSAAAKGWALWPEINAQLAYGHVFGQPMGVPGSQGSLRVNALTVMLSGKWAVWEWGASAYAQRQAQHGARAAHARAEAARRRVGSEVAARHAALVASASAIDVAQAQVTSAEEAFRVMQASRSAGSATTTDLLQAEAMRTQARMNLVSARYDTLLAHVALQRALGADTVMDNLPKP